MKHNLSHYQPHRPFLPKSRRFQGLAPAFTLVEMLIVITIITVLLTVGAMGLKNMAKASGVSAALPVAESIFAEARAIAQGKGTNTRVYIHAENDFQNEYHRERYLRYMAVAYEELNDDGEPNGTWVIASKGTALPKGVYFVKSLSETGGLSVETESNVGLPGGPDAKASCYYYQFNAEGLVSKPLPSGDDMPRFVIRSGSLPPGADEPVASGSGKKNVGGFVIWRSGRTSMFRHPDQIDPSL